MTLEYNRLLIKRAIVKMFPLRILLSTVLFLTLFSIPVFATEDYVHTEGIYLGESREKLMDWMCRYLPYNPSIVILKESIEDGAKYTNTWPMGTISYCNLEDPSKDYSCDLLWINSNGDELILLKRATSLLKKAKVVYLSTQPIQQGIHWEKMKRLMHASGFGLVSHWFKKEERGDAIFVRLDILEGERNCLACSPHHLKEAEIRSPPLNLKPFLKIVRDKPTTCQMKGIDFIYMINLDERPEKFEATRASLAIYGIHPYRFSAVNGWKLPLHEINELGIQFYQNMLAKKLMGSTFEMGLDRIYRSNEFIKANGKTYFPLGMTQGAIGIILSHLSVLQDAYESGYQTIWIMEDDVDPIQDPRILSDLVCELDYLSPSWDILFTDTDTKDKEGNHISCRAVAARPNLRPQPIQTFLDQFYPLGTRFYRTGMRYGAYSMIIRRSGIEKILNYYKKYRIFLPYDMDFWLRGDFEMYCPTEDIVSHKPHSLSDNGTPSYEKSIENG